MGFSKSKQKSENSSQQTSQSFNQAYPFLQGALGGQVSNAGLGSSALASMLGLNGSTAGADAFNTFRNNSSYDFIKGEGLRGITGNNAAKGLLSSGSALRRITDYGSNLAGNFLNSYLAQLSGLSNNGLQAGQILAQAGNTANSQGTSFGNSSGSSIGANLG